MPKASVLPPLPNPSTTRGEGLLEWLPSPLAGEGLGERGLVGRGLGVAPSPQPLPRNLPAPQGVEPLSPCGRGVGERGEDRGLGARPLSPGPSPARGEGRNSCASAALEATGSGAPAGSAARWIGLPRNLRRVTGSPGLLSVRAEPVEALLEDLGARALRQVLPLSSCRVAPGAGTAPACQALPAPGCGLAPP